jgi:hypothetical protein
VIASREVPNHVNTPLAGQWHRRTPAELGRHRTKLKRFWNRQRRRQCLKNPNCAYIPWTRSILLDELKQLFPQPTKPPTMRHISEVKPARV